MKLGELLEEVKIGSENYKSLKTMEQIQESFDEDMENYKISDLVGIHLQNLMAENVDEKITKVLKNTMAKINSIEERQEKTTYLSESYSRMKHDGLKTAYNDLVAIMENKRISRETNKEILANAMALIKYKIEEMAKLSNVDVSLNEAGEVFQPYIDKEYKIIKKTIS